MVVGYWTQQATPQRGISRVSRAKIRVNSRLKRTKLTNVRREKETKKKLYTKQLHFPKRILENVMK